MKYTKCKKTFCFRNTRGLQLVYSKVEDGREKVKYVSVCEKHYDTYLSELPGYEPKV